MKVLSFGSLNIDYVYDVAHFVEAGETLSSYDLHSFSGGKGLNQSIALARAMEVEQEKQSVMPAPSESELPIYHAGAVGKDGLFLLDELRSAGVNTDFVRVLDDIRTGHAIIQKTAEGDNCILVYGGSNRRITREMIDETLREFLHGDPEEAALILQNEISELPYLIERARECGMTIVLNPSPFQGYLMELIPMVDYLILNEVEAGQMLRLAESEKGDISIPVREPQEADQLGRALLELFTGVKIVLTLGEDGSIFLDGDDLIKVEAERVHAVDTTAAGDTYTGYFVAGILSGDDPGTAMKRASRAAAIAVTRPGAAPSIPHRGEVTI